MRNRRSVRRWEHQSRQPLRGPDRAWRKAYIGCPRFASTDSKDGATVRGESRGSVVSPTVWEHLNAPVDGNRECRGEGQHIHDDRHVGIGPDRRSSGGSPVEADGIRALSMCGMHRVSVARSKMLCRCTIRTELTGRGKRTAVSWESCPTCSPPIRISGSAAGNWDITPTLPSSRRSRRPCSSTYAATSSRFRCSAVATTRTPTAAAVITAPAQMGDV